MFVGIDLVDIPRIARAIENSRFVARVYSVQEREFAGTIASTNRQVEFYAGRFAVKEAAFKALSTLYQRLMLPHLEGDSIPRLPPLIFHEIETLKTDEGLPTLHFLGQTAQTFAAFAPLQAEVSLSHTATLATAIVLLQPALNDSRQPSQKQPQYDTD